MFGIKSPDCTEELYKSDGGWKRSVLFLGCTYKGRGVRLMGSLMVAILLHCLTAATHNVSVMC